MKKWAVGAAAAIAVTIPASAQGATSRCHAPHGASTAGQGHFAVVYQISSGYFRLCDKRTGRSHPMSGPFYGEHYGVGKPVFSGNFTALTWSLNDTYTDIGVFDVRTGRRSLHLPWNQICSVDIVVVNARGSVAWGCSNSLTTDDRPPEIDASDSHGKRGIDSEKGIDVNSLRLSNMGTQLSWKVNGVSKTAPLY